MNSYLDFVPEPYIYQTTGRYDGRTSKVLEMEYDGRKVYVPAIRAGYCPREGAPHAGTDAKIEAYETLESDEIFGYVFHTADAFGDTDCDLSELEKWMKFLYENDPEGGKRMTITDLMEEYVIPNDLVMRDVHLPCPEKSETRDNLANQYTFKNPDGLGCVGTVEDRFKLGRTRPKCGDGVCYEENLETCPQDCEGLLNR